MHLETACHFSASQFRFLPLFPTFPHLPELVPSGRADLQYASIEPSANWVGSLAASSSAPHRRSITHAGLKRQIGSSIAVFYYRVAICLPSWDFPPTRGRGPRLYGHPPTVVVLLVTLSDLIAIVVRGRYRTSMSLIQFLLALY